MRRTLRYRQHRLAHLRLLQRRIAYLSKRVQLLPLRSLHLAWPAVAWHHGQLRHQPSRLSLLKSSRRRTGPRPHRQTRLGRCYRPVFPRSCTARYWTNRDSGMGMRNGGGRISCDVSRYVGESCCCNHLLAGLWRSTVLHTVRRVDTLYVLLIYLSPCSDNLENLTRSLPLLSFTLTAPSWACPSSSLTPHSAQTPNQAPSPTSHTPLPTSPNHSPNPPLHLYTRSAYDPPACETHLHGIY